VYGLGAILRDLMAARGDAIPRPLAAIRDRALAPEPAARYPEAMAFRDDLGRFLDGDRVRAYRERPVEVIVRVLRPYRGAILLVVAYLVMRLAVLWWRGI
jgi:hypothetical protein